MKASYVLSFLGGAAAMLGLSTLRRSNAESPHHVYELRLYHVNEGKMDALRARFGNYTDAIFKRHNMKSVGYWSPEDAPSSQNLFIYILEHPSRQEAEKNWGCFSSRSGMAKGEDRIRGARGTGGPYRPVFHGSNQLFDPELVASNGEGDSVFFDSTHPGFNPVRKVPASSFAAARE
jgi:hypothetical protein